MKWIMYLKNNSIEEKISHYIYKDVVFQITVNFQFCLF